MKNYATLLSYIMRDDLIRVISASCPKNLNDWCDLNLSEMRTTFTIWLLNQDAKTVQYVESKLRERNPDRFNEWLASMFNQTGNGNTNMQFINTGTISHTGIGNQNIGNTSTYSLKQIQGLLTCGNRKVLSITDCTELVGVPGFERWGFSTLDFSENLQFHVALLSTAINATNKLCHTRGLDPDTERICIPKVWTEELEGKFKLGLQLFVNVYVLKMKFLKSGSQNDWAKWSESKNKTRREVRELSDSLNEIKHVTIS